MEISIPLPPHLEQFVRELLANGLFQTEGDLIQAALRLLEDQSAYHGSQQSGPITGLQGDDVPASRSSRRSPRGILADIRSYISPDDIKEARREMWARFPHGEA